MSKDEERRAQAAAAKAAAESTAKKERLVRFVGSGVVVAIVAVIIGVGVFASGNGESTDQIPLTGTLPTGVAEDGSWSYNPDVETEATLELYKDFQCPGCGWFEGTYGIAVKKLADDGIVEVVLHPAVFLDNNFPGQNSSRALNALGCAIDQGKGVEFKALVYAAQPATEGTGWTDDQFFEIGTAADISNIAQFKECVVGYEHMIWADVASKAFADSGVSSTPTIKLNGTEVPADVLEANDPEAFYNWVKANA